MYSNMVKMFPQNWCEHVVNIHQTLWKFVLEHGINEREKWVCLGVCVKQHTIWASMTQVVLVFVWLKNEELKIGARYCSHTLIKHRRDNLPLSCFVVYQYKVFVCVQVYGIHGSVPIYHDVCMSASVLWCMYCVSKTSSWLCFTPVTRTTRTRISSLVSNSIIFHQFCELSLSAKFLVCSIRPSGGWPSQGC